MDNYPPGFDPADLDDPNTDELIAKEEYLIQVDEDNLLERKRENDRQSKRH